MQYFIIIALRATNQRPIFVCTLEICLVLHERGAGTNLRMWMENVFGDSLKCVWLMQDSGGLINCIFIMWAFLCLTSLLREERWNAKLWERCGNLGVPYDHCWIWIWWGKRLNSDEENIFKSIFPTIYSLSCVFLWRAQKHAYR